MIVSIYKNVTDTEGAKANLFDVLTTDKWRYLSDKVRAETDKTKRNKLKQQLLPAFTPSGIFRENKRNDKGLIKHSGYMCIDIDGDDNPNISNWQGVVFELGKLPQIAFAGLSVSANGVFALIPIKYPNRHEEHFNAFQKSFKNRGLVIDPKCGNVSRLRFYSYNEHYHINRDAEPYLHLYKEPIRPNPKPIKSTLAPTRYSNELDAEILVREIVASGVNIVPDYNSWFNAGAALSNLPNGRKLFHTLSQVDASRYNYKECNKMFDHIKPGKGITIKTLFYMAKNNGVTFKRSHNSNAISDFSKPKSTNKSQLFASWSKPKRAEIPASQQQAEDPKHQDKKLDCFVDNDGKLYIPHPCGDDTLAVHKSIEHYNSRKRLLAIMDKGQIDTSQMEKRHIDLDTLLVH